MTSNNHQIYWKIRNELSDTILEVAHYKRDARPEFEKLPSRHTLRYRSFGPEGRIAIRVYKPKSYRLLFTKNKFPDWIEIQSQNNKYTAVNFPNGTDDDSLGEGDTKTVTIAEPE